MNENAIGKEEVDAAL